MAGAIADLKNAAGKALGALKAIGFSGQMHGAVLLDRADKPVRPAILHNDGRAFREADELARDYPDLARVVGVKPMPGFTGPKLKWIARNEPDHRRLINSLLSPKDYLRLELSGERGSDMSDAAGTWLLDEARRAWSPASVRRVRRGSRLGAAFVRRIGAGRPDPARGRGRAWPAARRSAGGRRRRRRRWRGGLGRDRAGRSLHFARNRDPAHRRDRPIHERAGKARALLSPMRCRTAGTRWRRCSTAPARSLSPGGFSARRRTRSSARRRRTIPAPARFSFCPILAASGRRSTILMRAAFCSA